jgi:prevent-host-death family protein
MRVDVRCEPYGENVSKSRWGKATALLGDLSTRKMIAHENHFDYSRDYGYFLFMKMVSKGKLKPKMLEYFREVERTGEPLLVTDHGRAVLVVQPVEDRKIMTASDVLARYRAGTTPQQEVSEEEFMAAQACEDWEVLREDDRNPW